MPERHESAAEHPPPVESLVELDGRWAQVLGADHVRYLDDKSVVMIDWSEYEGIPFEADGTPDPTVDRAFLPDLLRIQAITDDQVKNIMLGSDSFEVKSTARVAGRYRRKG